VPVLLVFVEVNLHHHRIAQEINFANFNAIDFDACSLLEIGNQLRTAAFLNERNLSPRVSMEMSSNESIKQAVMANLGISFVSLHTVGLEVQTNKLVVLDIDETPISRAWHVVALNRSNHSAAAEAFRYFVLEHGAELLSEI
jgi:DNA-binding transcriptional LysR family regulator